MELRHLEIFAAVVRYGGFSAAAREIGSTQSTVSKAILQLEHDCGASLLARLPLGVIPTEAGRMVLDHSRIMLSEREHLVDALKSLRGVESGCLKVGMPLIGSDTLFAPVLGEFLRRHPAIRIELREDGGQRLEDAVQCGKVEIAASLLPAPETFASHAVCDEPMMAILPSSHPLARRHRIRLPELADTPCILYAQGFSLNAVIASAYARHDLPLLVAARSAQPDFIMALASAGLGVGYLPRIMVTSRQGSKAVPVDEPEFRWRLGLIWRRNARLSPAASRFLEIAKEMLPSAQNAN